MALPTEKSDKGQRARLIPVAGISSEREAEVRATSALLAVLSIARDLSIELLCPHGASRARRATVETFTEVPFNLHGKSVRPDGLIRVTYGQATWTCLVEVKTGTMNIAPEQVNMYWDVARQHGFNHVLTVSNEIAQSSGTHPTAGLRVRSSSKTQVSHISWASILTTCIRIINHQGVDDPEQAWILSELIRYMEHPASGVMSFDDMGASWTAIRDGARTSTLSKNTEGIEEVASRFDQLIRYAALTLSAQVGLAVEPVLAKAHRDPKARLNYLVSRLASDGVMDGRLRVPNTAGDIELAADLRGQQLVLAMGVDAPVDRGSRARVSWLINQVPADGASNITLETYAKNARTPATAQLHTVREDRMAALAGTKSEPFRFRLVQRSPMGTTRRPTNRAKGFVGSVLDGISSFYDTVVQGVTPWQAAAPRRKVEPETRQTETTDDDLKDKIEPELWAIAQPGTPASDTLGPGDSAGSG